jgi:Mrp family chromosome partitioning ATPase
MISIPEFLTTAPRYPFFTGKGGVGKTSLACASAVLLADKGRLGADIVNRATKATAPKAKRTPPIVSR